MACTLPAHSYLGDLQDLPGRTPLLETGITYQIPMLPIEDTIVCPGDVFPLRVADPRLRQIIRTAMEAPAPISRLLAIIMVNPRVPMFHGGTPFAFESVACTLEIIKQSSDGTILLTKARQRVDLDFENSPQPLDFQRISMKVLPDILQRPLPFSANANQAAFPRFVYQIVDPTTLAKAAQKLFNQRIPDQGPVKTSIDPIDLSFKLIGNLPFNPSQRRTLLQTDLITDRLNKEIEWLREMDGLYCRQCYHKIAEIGDLVQINDEGTGGHYVNSHGSLHDMLTLRTAAVRIVSEPETENSWFHGYAWQIAYCEGCTEHLGWHFTSVGVGDPHYDVSGERGEALGVLVGGPEPRFLPDRFFGLRTAAIDNKDRADREIDGRRVFFDILGRYVDEFGIDSEGEDGTTADEEESEEEDGGSDREEEGEEGEEGSEYETDSGPDE